MISLYTVRFLENEKGPVHRTDETGNEGDSVSVMVPTPHSTYKEITESKYFLTILRNIFIQDLAL